MKHLRALFEEQLEIIADKQGNAVIGKTVFSPALILRADPVAYEAEYNAWLSEQWLPEQLDRLEAVLGRYGNRKRFTDLCKAIEKDQVAPFMGSGTSVPTGLLTWSDFLRSICKFSKLSQKTLESLLLKSAFEEAVDRLMGTMPVRLFNERVEHDLRVDNPLSIAGPIRYLPSIFPTFVLTSNLDDLLEHLYANEGHAFAHVLAGINVGRYRQLKAESESFLLKLHGDCRTRDGRVLGSAEYAKAYASKGLVAQELSLISRTKNLLFVGCSLGADRTVKLMTRISSDEGMPKHYAFLQEPLGEERLKREHFLSKRGIFPIWYQNGHDENIEALFVGILKYLGRL